MIKVAHVGHGNWGKNIARNVHAQENAELTVICELNEEQRQKVASLYPTVKTTNDFNSILADDSIQAVTIATNAPYHYELGIRSLKAGKHTFIEKPLTLSSKESAELIEVAEKNNLKLMVGHLLEYHDCVNYLKNLIDNKVLGDLLYVYSQRLNLGVVRNNENAWWSLAPHDVSVANYLMGEAPESVMASGHAHLQPGIEDVTFATLKYPSGKIANIHVSWLDPHKIRKIVAVGSEKMAVFDDMEPVEKIRVYDNSFEYQGEADNRRVVAKRGEVHIPEMAWGEPLFDEIQHFINAIINDTKIRSDGWDGLHVVQVLEAGSESIKNGGALVYMNK